MIGSANGARIGITGLGVHVLERVVTNDELARHVDTTDEWIMERTGIRERRMAADDEAPTDIALLRCPRAALVDADVEAGEIDLLISATVTPDMMFPTSSALMAATLGAPNAAAYDLLAGAPASSTRSQRYGMLASGLCRRALVVGGDVLSSILDWE